jgi:hypothetical protein
MDRITEEIDETKKADDSFSILRTLYYDMKDIGKMHKKTSGEFDKLNECFKQQLENFKKNYGFLLVAQNLIFLDNCYI